MFQTTNQILLVIDPAISPLHQNLRWYLVSQITLFFLRCFNPYDRRVYQTDIGFWMDKYSKYGYTHIYMYIYIYVWINMDKVYPFGNQELYLIPCYWDLKSNDYSTPIIVFFESPPHCT